MKEEQQSYRIDDPAYPFRPVAILTGTTMGFGLACALIENGPDRDTLLAFAVGVPLVLGMLALLCRLLKKYRFQVDERGIKIDAIFGRGAELLWKDVRTAAIVHYDGSKELVLSVGEPAEVLVKKRLMRVGRNSSEEMHFGASNRMCVLAEYYLHMTLPEIRL